MPGSTYISQNPSQPLNIQQSPDSNALTSHQQLIKNVNEYANQVKTTFINAANHRKGVMAIKVLGAFIGTLTAVMGGCLAGTGVLIIPGLIIVGTGLGLIAISYGIAKAYNYCLEEKNSLKVKVMVENLNLCLKDLEFLENNEDNIEKKNKYREKKEGFAKVLNKLSSINNDSSEEEKNDAISALLSQFDINNNTYFEEAIRKWMNNGVFKELQNNENQKEQHQVLSQNQNLMPI